MRYVILGAGAIGGTIGGRLAQAGLETVWVARGDHGRALRERGLRLLTPEGEVEAEAPVWLSPAEADLRRDDVLVVATKTHHVADALAAWADLGVAGTSATAGECLPVVLATNGVAAEAMALRWFARVYGLCVWAPCAHLEPGVVVARFAGVSAVLHASRVPAGLTDESDRTLLRTLADDWGRARLDVPLPDDVMPWKYRKLIGNLGNVAQALVGLDGGGDEVVAAARAEARAVFAAAGVPVVDESTEAAARRAGPRVASVEGAPDAGGSTWQSLARGTGDIETDFLNGEVVALAHAHGLQAPVNAALARLGRRAAASGDRPGALTASELRRLTGC